MKDSTTQMFYTFHISCLLRFAVALTLLGLTTRCGGYPADRSSETSQVPTRPPEAMALVPNIPTPTVAGWQLDATKQALADAIQHDVATAAALPAPRPHTTPYIFPTLPPVDLKLGITTYDCIDAYERELDAKNCWTGRINDEYIFAIAGAALKDHQQGAIAVLTSTLNQSNITERVIYPTPQKIGAISIVQVHDAQLTLRTEQGALFHFDVITRRWEEP